MDPLDFELSFLENVTTHNLRTPGDGTISTAKLADNAVTAVKIADGAVTVDKITPSFITLNTKTISANYTLSTSYNGVSAGPITINSGVTVTIPSGSAWSIV